MHGKNSKWFENRWKKKKEPSRSYLTVSTTVELPTVRMLTGISAQSLTASSFLLLLP